MDDPQVEFKINSQGKIISEGVRNIKDLYKEFDLEYPDSDATTLGGYVMNLAKKILSQEGVFLTKVFMGSIFKEINKEANCSFKQVVKYKPLSSKKESKEIYIFCKGILNV